MTQQSSNNAESPLSFRVGDARVTRIPELRWTNADPARLYPDLDAAALGIHGGQLTAGSHDPATGTLAQSTHSLAGAACRAGHPDRHSHRQRQE